MIDYYNNTTNRIDMFSLLLNSFIRDFTSFQHLHNFGLRGEKRKKNGYVFNVQFTRSTKRSKRILIPINLASKGKNTSKKCFAKIYLSLVVMLPPLLRLVGHIKLHRQEFNSIKSRSTNLRIHR